LNTLAELALLQISGGEAMRPIGDKAAALAVEAPCGACS
jgi:hypothetical protein